MIGRISVGGSSSLGEWSRCLPPLPLPPFQGPADGGGRKTGGIGHVPRNGCGLQGIVPSLPVSQLRWLPGVWCWKPVDMPGCPPLSPAAASQGLQQSREQNPTFEVPELYPVIKTKICSTCSLASSPHLSLRAGERAAFPSSHPSLSSLLPQRWFGLVVSRWATALTARMRPPSSN